MSETNNETYFIERVSAFIDEYYGQLPELALPSKMDKSSYIDYCRNLYIAKYGSYFIERNVDRFMSRVTDHSKEMKSNGFNNHPI